MSSLRHRIRGRLHRRLFVGFGITILAVFIGVGLAMHAFSNTFPPPWEQDLKRMSQFVGGQFGQVWHEAAARNRLADAMSEQLNLRLILFDSSGKQLSIHGGHCRGRSWEVPVQGRGRVAVCIPHRRQGGARLALGLGLLGLILWLGSGLLARRVTRPLGELAQVTRDIGAGRLHARATVPGHDEVSSLAHCINDMAERIQTQLKDQQTLLAAVSHELRTPLGHLRLLVELANTPELSSEDRTQALQDIDGEVKEMDNLVGELVASSRLEFSNISPEFIEPKDTAERALSRAGLSADLLELRAAPSPIFADPTLLARALANLIRNAESHGAGLSRLIVRKIEDSVVFEIEDAGPGIPEDALEEVFRPFHRANSKEGLGLGLALVSRIAQAHEGRAYAENRPEGGARVGFSCRLTSSESSRSQG